MRFDISKLVVPFLTFLTGVSFSTDAKAYPEFIGYGYSSCLTCHFNSQGNGPLNDYGRALWSAEIAGRAFAGKSSDEQLGEKSGFLFGAKQPWWLKPSLKGRVLNYQQNPGGNVVSKSIVMQAEAALGILFDEDAKWMVMGSFGYVPVPSRLEGKPGADTIDTYISREHYIRWNAKKNLWVYAGMMDRAYGLRIVNHTAFSRTATGMTMNDQSHGVMVHYIQPKYELTANPFIGNMYQEAPLRQAGIALMGEYEFAENWRMGLSLLQSQNKFVQNRRVGLHSKNGFGNGSSVMAEIGVSENLPVETLENSLGYYFYSQFTQKLARGYHIFFTGQATNPTMSSKSSDRLRYGVGLLMFPLARTEFRFDLENTRNLTYESVQPDVWTLSSQLHLSF